MKRFNKMNTVRQGFKAFTLASNPKYDGYQRGLTSMIYKFFIRNLVEVVLLINQLISWQMSFINSLLKHEQI